MNDSRTGFEAKTKRELVELLLAEVTAWHGGVPLAKARREQVRAALLLLGLCPLWLGERHWHGLCEIWTKRAARPDLWLRQFWLETLRQWLCFLDDIGLAADALPAAPSYPHPPPPLELHTEPDPLPFGFVRPMIG